MQNTDSYTDRTGQQIVSEFDQEMPQSQTLDQLMAP